MNSVLRYLCMVAIAAVLTLSSFYLMHRLIAQAPQSPPLVHTEHSIHFGPVDIPEDPRRKVREVAPEEPEPVEQPTIPQRGPITRIVPDRSMVDLAPSDYGEKILTGGVQPVPPSSNRDARPTNPIAPIYPRRAALEGVEGWVRVEVVVDANGLVRSSRVIDSDPRGVFDDAALRSVNRWSWEPRLVNGRPVQQTVVQELVFSLNES
ncbi:energy transducer TonB [Wenzhouxiangella marina]|uniref:Protein TonB n=1 Tax=Wenzhouxiangella marina TaxID=1579979 RepID=A0A0K0XSI3_9GAMM|nr:energy transducer TonB [Wenzhouxiangella marina]AKS40582.1 hypothetical protein WM2015_193 [Wenzhouxiangella marina]MBB6088350.1 protein TonB [Wenzhouxiangella marina]